MVSGLVVRNSGIYPKSKPPIYQEVIVRNEMLRMYIYICVCLTSRGNFSKSLDLLWSLPTSWSFPWSQKVQRFQQWGFKFFLWHAPFKKRSLKEYAWQTLKICSKQPHEMRHSTFTSSKLPIFSDLKRFGSHGGAAGHVSQKILKISGNDTPRNLGSGTHKKLQLWKMDGFSFAKWVGIHLQKVHFPSPC